LVCRAGSAEKLGDEAANALPAYTTRFSDLMRVKV